MPETGGRSSPRLPEGVAGTGYSIACWRAEESKRDDHLFDDPLASVFAATGSGPSAHIDFEQHTQEEFKDLIAFGAVTQFAFAVRTRFFDDFLRAASDSCQQVVILAAGLDARAFRLPWPPSVHVFEVDMAAVFDFKEEVLRSVDAAPACIRTTVSADLAGDWMSVLRNTGFDPGTPTAWLAEGLMLYLTSEQASALLSNIAELSSAGSQLAFEHGPYAEAALLDRINSTQAMRDSVSTWHGGLREDPATWLNARGWTAMTHDIAEVGSALGRVPPPHLAVDLIAATR